MKVLILCCHGVYHRGNLYADRVAEREVYKSHLEESLRQLYDGKADTLIISGGYTKPHEEKSEARGYLDWAQRGYFDWAQEKGARPPDILLEEFARSSVENLLFSMCRFYQYFGRFPTEVATTTLVWKNVWFREIGKSLKLPNFSVMDISGENNLLEELLPQGAIFPDKDMVAKKNSDDILERKSFKKVLSRDPWKKGNPYESIPIFQEMFKTLNQMGAEGNPNLPPGFKFPWE